MICKTKIHVRFADIDSMGHVNNATYLSYFEQARIDFFHKNFSGGWDWKKDGLVLVKNELEYLLPVFLNDDISIHTSVLSVGTKSFTFHYHVVKKNKEQKEIICCKGTSVLVTFDHQSQKSITIPEKWKTVLLSKISK